MNLIIRQTASYVGNDGEHRWNWSVWIDGPDAELDQVEWVEWILHDTFPNPIVRVTQRQSKFRLDQNGWGEFEINAHVMAKDGQLQHLKHRLRLAESAGRSAQPAPAQQPASYARPGQPSAPLDQTATGRSNDIGGKVPVESAGIFVSYRRQDSGPFTGWLCERLMRSFGAGRVFFDLDTLPPGVDFRQAIVDAVARCQVLLAIIGPQWLTATDQRGRRLENANDFVRLEIEAALARHVRVIPILVDDTAMPRRKDLPGSLESLVDRQAFIIHVESFPNDADRLVRELRSIISDR